jgi:PEP-CTERM motif
MKWMARMLVVLGILAVGLMGAAHPAQAITYNLTSDHCTGGCGPAGTIFGVVTLTQTGTTVDVTVDLSPGFGYAKTGAVDNQAFKFNATGVALGEITVDLHVPVLVAATGAFNGDGTGTFGFGINCPSCGGGGSDAFTNNIVFHVANATIADLTVANSLGNVFVADIINLTTQVTGPVDATVPNTSVAEPGSLLLMGFGMVLAGILGKRRKRQ